MNMLYHFLNAGSLKSMGHSQLRSVRIFNMTLLCAIVMCAYFAVFYSYYQIHQILPLIFISETLFVISILIHAYGKRNMGRLLATITSSCLIFYSAAILRGLANVQLFYITTVLLIFVIYELEDRVVTLVAICIPISFYLIGEFYHYEFFERAILPPHLGLLKGSVLSINLLMIVFTIFFHVRLTNKFEMEREQYLELLTSNIKNQMQQMKMASLGEMAASISHEVNNPLTIILGKASVLKMNIENENYDMDNFIQQLTSIEEASLRINQILKILKTYSKSEEHEEFSFYSLREIVQNSQILLNRKFRSQTIVFQNEIAEDLQLFCRQSQFMQALFNLINLSLHHLSETEGAWIKVISYVKNNLVHIQIEDSGQHIGHELSAMNKTSTIDSPKALELQIAYSVANQIIHEHQGELVIPKENISSILITLPLVNPNS